VHVALLASLFKTMYNPLIAQLLKERNDAHDAATTDVLSSGAGAGAGAGADADAAAVAMPRKLKSNVVYALFLESVESKQERLHMSTAEWLVDEAARHFDVATAVPSKVTHVELLVPAVAGSSSGGRIHFATYFGGDGAQWQNRMDKTDGIDFYLVQNGSRWRALPIIINDTVDGVRRAADANIGAPYSLGMYLTSTVALRPLASAWSDKPGARAHCAVVTARVLKMCNTATPLKHASAWYSPSSLYNAIYRNSVAISNEGPTTALDSSNVSDCTTAMAHLLHGPMSTETIRSLGDEGCARVIAQLTSNVYATARAGNATDARSAQRDLATGLLKWSLLREDDHAQVAP
jgi:hypothetical protein